MKIKSLFLNRLFWDFCLRSINLISRLIYLANCYLVDLNSFKRDLRLLVVGINLELGIPLSLSLH